MKVVSGKQEFVIKGIIHGPPGSGKTRLAASANEVPEMREVVVVSLSGGAKMTLTESQHDGIDLENELRRASDAEAIIWKIKSRAKGYENVRTLILDDASEVVKCELAEIVKEANERGQRDSKDETQLRDFMIRQSRIFRLLRMARDLPINVFLTCWSREQFAKADKDKPGAKPIAIVPDFPDSIVPTLMGYYDACWYLHHDGATGKRTLITQKHGLYDCKTRGLEFAKRLGMQKDGKFVPFLEDPSMEKIVAAFNASTKEQK
jgi:hypothetical protein